MRGSNGSLVATILTVAGVALLFPALVQATGAIDAGSWEYAAQLDLIIEALPLIAAVALVMLVLFEVQRRN